MPLPFALMLLLPVQDRPDPPIIIPPLAAEVTGTPEQVTLGPIFAEGFSCTEHWLGQLPYAGDALGADCRTEGGVEGESGFMRGYRTDGKANEDWYVWGAPVLAPVSGMVVGMIDRPGANAPGTMGRPPANMVQIRTADGIIVTLAHVTQVSVKRGDTVTAGQPIAKVGNNGMSRAPHIHVGAWREADAMPLQIRWDLRAMGAAIQAAGKD